MLMFEPEAVRWRAERGRGQARVETWQESSGNWGMAGRELAAADAITADERLTAMARALKDAGAVDAGTCRDLAGRLTTGPGARWCVTLTGTGRNAVGTTRSSKPPDGTSASPNPAP